MANSDNDKQIPGGQEGTTGNDRGMNESGAGLDAEEGNMQNGKIGGAGLPDNMDSSTDSSSGAGSTGGDVGGGATTTGTGNS
ncbi:MAG: hypothetical protein H0X70_02885 [Segetibacter sp.]|jgi:hypothetical protein|nr:hypothetical protein [Segetibacter sp.]